MKMKGNSWYCKATPKRAKKDLVKPEEQLRNFSSSRKKRLAWLNPKDA
jgi:hypothetical protein